jgi:hypothetical protein
MFTCALAVALLLMMTSKPSTAVAVDKMKAEDVLARHLEALGPAEARSNAHSRVVVGTARAVFAARSNMGTIDGDVVLGSIDRRIVYAMKFPSPNYPAEKFGFDGKKLTVGYLKPGLRSTLGSFVLIRDTVFKEGLMGGTLSAAWPLLNLAERGAKLDYSGTTKIDGQLAHKLEYLPKKGSDLTITLYFDATTFRHLRTQYEQVAGARLGAGGIDNQSSQRAARYKMIEDFSDYKQEGALNLPHHYKLELNIETTTGNSAHKWEMSLNQFTFKEAIDEKLFNAEVN